MISVEQESLGRKLLQKNSPGLRPDYLFDFDELL